jgi:hypothetical protein
MQEEIWKDAIGFEEYYQVSSLGRVRSKDRVIRNKHSTRLFKGVISNPSKRKSNYIRVVFSCHGKNKTFDVHRIVALTFFNIKETKLTVNHINGNKHDNRIENLELITQAENNLHKYRVLKIKQPSRVGVNNPNYGKTMSKETREKISKRLKLHYEARRNL